MFADGKAWIAQVMDSGERVVLEPSMANRHGLITGATGTGKTITLKVMAETFSAMGVPVFLSDVKGDLAGMCVPGEDNEGMQKRIDRFKLHEYWSYIDFPTRIWDIFGEQGTPVCTTISEMGPVLLSRLMGLNDVQTGVMNIVFRVADEDGLLLLDLKDLRSMVNHVGENAKDYRLRYGNIAAASIGAIQRSLLALEDQGADLFFGDFYF